jgi:hypothetical protein
MLSKVERQEAVKPVLLKLQELRLNPTTYESIKLLYQQIQLYIQTGERKELNIPFPEYNVTIKGVLATDKVEKVWVKLERNPTFADEN